MKKVFRLFDREEALSFKRLLENHGIECNLTAIGYDIIVDDQIYEKALQKGKELNRNCAKNLRKEMLWYDEFDNLHNIKKTIIMTLKIPNSRKLYFNCADDIKYPYDIDYFISELATNLMTKISYIYDEINNKIMIETSDGVEMDVIKMRANIFLIKYKNDIPFEKITFCNELGQEEKEHVQKKETPPIRTYFNNSFFIKDITNPKQYTKPLYENGIGYILEKVYNSIRNFNITNVIGNKTIFWKEKIWGNFLLDEHKIYGDYFNRGYHRNSEGNNSFTMLDNGDFITEIRVSNTEKNHGVTVTTQINLIRNVVGYDLDGFSARDKIFADTPHTDIRNYFELKDYYYVLSCQNILIHFSNLDDTVELYYKNDGIWILSEGINELPDLTCSLSNIENSCKYNEYYEEIKELVNSKKEKDVLIKKKQK